MCCIFFVARGGLPGARGGAEGSGGSTRFKPGLTCPAAAGPRRGLPARRALAHGCERPPEADPRCCSFGRERSGVPRRPPIEPRARRRTGRSRTQSGGFLRLRGRCVSDATGCSWSELDSARAGTHAAREGRAVVGTVARKGTVAGRASASKGRVECSSQSGGFLRLRGRCVADATWWAEKRADAPHVQRPVARKTLVVAECHSARAMASSPAKGRLPLKSSTSAAHAAVLDASKVIACKMLDAPDRQPSTRGNVGLEPSSHQSEFNARARPRTPRLAASSPFAQHGPPRGPTETPPQLS